MNAPNKKYRVVQWATGNVGSRAMRHVIEHPDLELVGVWVHSASKAGKDAGELAGVAPIGVKATNSIKDVLALKPDCVCYTPNQLDPEELVRLLDAGVNVASSYFINGRTLGSDVRARVESAARRGGASVFGAGIFPGFANFIAALMAAAY